VAFAIVKKKKKDVIRGRNLIIVDIIRVSRFLDILVYTAN
jgi:hypothetical protein